eukprot:1921948-Alexandrium_andersonii.AAC.1
MEPFYSSPAPAAAPSWQRHSASTHSSSQSRPRRPSVSCTRLPPSGRPETRARIKWPSSIGPARSRSAA